MSLVVFLVQINNFEETSVNQKVSFAVHMSFTLRLVPIRGTPSESCGIPRKSRRIISGGRDIPRAALRAPATPLEIWRLAQEMLWEENAVGDEPGPPLRVLSEGAFACHAAPAFLLILVVPHLHPPLLTPPPLPPPPPPLPPPPPPLSPPSPLPSQPSGHGGGEGGLQLLPGHR